jgi:Arc/MetJ-type ribon-helix-helix transcriptional regulator
MTVKDFKDSRDSHSLRINISVRGPLADFAHELRKSGYVRNVPDLVSQALRALQDQVTERELAKARLDSIKRSRLDTE